MLAGALSHLKHGPTGLSFLHLSHGPYGEIWEFTADSASGSITLREDSGLVRLETIDIEPLGTGLGSRIVDELRRYCDSSGKQLLVPGVMNIEFFARFPWLSWREPEQGKELWQAHYQPRPM